MSAQSLLAPPVGWPCLPSAVKYAIVEETFQLIYCVSTPQCIRLTGLYMRLCVPVCPCERDHIGLRIDQKGLCVGGEVVEIPTCTAVCVGVCVGRHLAFECYYTLSI